MGAQFRLSGGRSGDLLCFPASLAGKESASTVGDLVLFLGWEDPLENGEATLSSILTWRIPMDRETWWAIVHRVAKSPTRLGQLSTAQHSGDSQELGHHPLFGLL